MKKIAVILLFLLLAAPIAATATAKEYDVVILNGRVDAYPVPDQLLVGKASW